MVAVLSKNIFLSIIKYEFITPEQFEQNKNKHDQIQRWRDVPLNVIYRIENVEEIPSKNGNATIVTLSDKDEEKTYSVCNKLSY